MYVVVYKGKGRKNWRVRLVSDNNRTLSISEGYYSKWNAKRAAKLMFPDLPIEDRS